MTLKTAAVIPGTADTSVVKADESSPWPLLGRKDRTGGEEALTARSTSGDGRSLSRNFAGAYQVAGASPSYYKGASFPDDVLRRVEKLEGNAKREATACNYGKPGALFSAECVRFPRGEKVGSQLAAIANQHPKEGDLDFPPGYSGKGRGMATAWASKLYQAFYDKNDLNTLQKDYLNQALVRRGHEEVRQRLAKGFLEGLSPDGKVNPNLIGERAADLFKSENPSRKKKPYDSYSTYAKDVYQTFRLAVLDLPENHPQKQAARTALEKVAAQYFQ
jgi:hypothetical protein